MTVVPGSSGEKNDGCCRYFLFVQRHKFLLLFFFFIMFFLLSIFLFFPSISVLPFVLFLFLFCFVFPSLFVLFFFPLFFRSFFLLPSPLGEGVFVSGKGGEMYPSPVLSWHRGRVVERP